jgi:hypothetical protein
VTEITSTNTRIWAQTDAYERISGLGLQPNKRIHVLALTGIRVVTQGFGRKSKLDKNSRTESVTSKSYPGNQRVFGIIKWVTGIFLREFQTN